MSKRHQKNKTQKEARKSRLNEQLEERIMFDAVPDGSLDLLGAIDDPLVPTVDASTEIFEVNSAIAGAQQGPQQNAVQFVFVDEGVEGYQQLVDALLDSNGEISREDIHYLNAEQDAFQQIAAVVKPFNNVDAIHIISHGDEGELRLSNTAIQGDDLTTKYADELSQIGQSLTSEADILLYGCDLAGNADGEAFLATLAELTGADVAASNDLTGHEDRGGDWELEVNVGMVEASAFEALEWHGILIDTDGDSVDDANDVDDDNDGILDSVEHDAQPISYSNTVFTIESDTGKLYRVDDVLSGSPTTTLVATTPLRNAELGFDHHGQLWAIAEGFTVEHLRLFHINLETGEVISYGDMPETVLDSSLEPYAFGFDEYGMGYVSTFNGDIFRFDPNSATPTKMTHWYTFNTINHLQDIMFAGDKAFLLGEDDSSSDEHLYEITLDANNEVVSTVELGILEYGYYGMGSYENDQLILTRYRHQEVDNHVYVVDLSNAPYMGMIPITAVAQISSTYAKVSGAASPEDVYYSTFDSDDDGVFDHLDIDSDNDGITDNVEAQSTAGYVAPSGVDLNNDGLDDAYDNRTVTALTSAATEDDVDSPVDTDGRYTPDYLDPDSDEDGISDAEEAGHFFDLAMLEADTDTDGDGLKDLVDADNVNWNPNDDDVDASGEQTLLDSDGDLSADRSNADPLNVDFDFREGADYDGDNVYDEIDVDDDNDGVLDVKEFDPQVINYSNTVFTIDSLSGALYRIDDVQSGSPTTTLVATTALVNAELGFDDHGQLWAIARGFTDAHLGLYHIDSETGEVISFGDLPETVLDSSIEPHAFGFDEHGIGYVSLADGRVYKFDPNSLSPTSTTLWHDFSPMEYMHDITFGGGRALLVGEDDSSSETHLYQITLDAENNFVSMTLLGTLESGYYGLGAYENDQLILTRDRGLEVDDHVYVADLSGAPYMGVIPMTALVDLGVSDAAPSGAASPEDVYYTTRDSDGDNVLDHLDIDSDNDGITDNVEAQSTAGYVAPSGVDLNRDGLDDAYDNRTVTALTSAAMKVDVDFPVDTDGDMTPDLLDTDSDGDGISDAEEAGHGYDLDTLTFIGFAEEDMDGDGLNDLVDTDTVSWDPNDDDVDASGEQTLLDSDGDLSADRSNADPLNVDFDFREGKDTDGDNIRDEFDVDDDNDGILDVEEGHAFLSTIFVIVEGTGELYRVDKTLTDSPERTLITTIDLKISDLAFDNQGQLWAIGSVRSAYSLSFQKLYQIDPQTGAVTEITDMRRLSIRVRDPITFGFDENGMGYIAGSGSSVYRFDPNNFYDTATLWHDFDTLKNLNDITFSNGKVFLVGDDDVTDDRNLYEITVDANNDFVSMTKLGELAANEYGLGAYVNDQLIFVKDSLSVFAADLSGAPYAGMIPVTEVAQIISDGNSLAAAASPKFNDDLKRDSDGDNVLDHLDIDSDNDGITDNVEAQSTAGYVAPSGVDLNKDGLDDAYDNRTVTTATAAATQADVDVPVDTDGDMTPDYLDTDSDGDGTSDAEEAGHGFDLDFLIDVGDDDGDGLNDFVDADNVNWDPNDDDVDASGEQTLLDSDGDLSADRSNTDPLNVDFDFREGKDTDGDNVHDEIDVDDDNDGILDIDELYVEGEVNSNTIFSIDDFGTFFRVDRAFSDAPITTVVASTQLNSAELAFDPDGHLWAIDRDSELLVPKLYQIDPLTGYTWEMADLSSFGFDANFSLAFDIDENGMGYVGGRNLATGTQVYRFDPNNFQASTTTLWHSYGPSIDRLGDITFINGKVFVVEYSQLSFGTRLSEFTVDENNDFVSRTTIASLDDAFYGLGSYDNDQLLITRSYGESSDQELFVGDLSGAPYLGNLPLTLVAQLSTRGRTLTGAASPEDFYIFTRNSDTDSIDDHLDIDSDNDGITDNVEAQSTAGYVAPSGVDLNKDGLDDAYDNRTVTTATAAATQADVDAPVDTDGDMTPDFLDTDSDNDGTSDAEEAGHGYDLDTLAVFRFIEGDVDDVDNDGLHDLVDADIVNWDPNNDDVDASGEQTLLDSDGDLSADRSNVDPLNVDFDFREGKDTDGDNVRDEIDVDDDNDGILDIEEGHKPFNTIFTLEHQTGKLYRVDKTLSDSPEETLIATTNLSAAELAFDPQGQLWAIGEGQSQFGQGQSSLGLVLYRFNSNFNHAWEVAHLSGILDDGTIPLAFDIDENGMGYVAGLDARVYRFDPNNFYDTVTLWHDFDTLKNLNDITFSNGKVFLVGDDDVTDDRNLYEITVDANNDFVSMTKLGELGDGEYGLGAYVNDQLVFAKNPLNVFVADLSGAPYAGMIPVTEVAQIISDGFWLAGAASPKSNDYSSRDSDGDSVFDHLDIDSDNDGITDNVESQPSVGYVVPSGVDLNNDGLDDAYDNRTVTAATAAATQTDVDAPVDTEGDMTPDYLDTDSDGDGTSDADEAGHGFDLATLDADTDTDGDGLKDLVDADNVNWDPNDDDIADSVQWLISGASSVNEGASIDYVISLSNELYYGQVVTVDLSVADVDTTSSDYGIFSAAVQTAVDNYSGPGTLNWNGTTLSFENDGMGPMTPLTISLTVTNDNMIEGPDDFNVTLSNPTWENGTVTLGTSAFTTTINDPEGTDTVQWSLTGPASSEEGTTPQYTVALSGTFGAGEVISVDLDLSDLDSSSDEYDDLIAAIQTAADANSNVTFDSTNGTLTYTSPSDGSSMADLVIDLPLTDDGFIEGPEDFEFGLMNAASTTGLSPTVSATEGSITTTINDAADSDSSAEWSLTGPASSEEGTTPQYTVALSGTFGAGEVISVDLDLSDLDNTSDEYDDLIAAIQTAADANSNVTFDSTNGTLTYTSPSDGSSMADLVIDLPLTDDGFIEGPEDFEFGLMNAASTTGLSPTVSATEGSITTTINDPADSDSSAEWSLTGPASSEEGTTPQYTVALSGTFGAGEVISVDLDLSDLDSSSDEYDDLIAAIQTAADANSNVTFDSTNGTLTYTSPSDGSSMADLVIDLPLTDDGFIEGPEDFEFGLMNAASTTGLSPTVSTTEGSITTTINDPADSDSSAEWSLTGPASSEEGTTPQYTVALSGTFGAGEVISVDLDLSDLDSSSDEYDDLIAAIQTAADANSNVTFDSTNGTLTYTSPSDGSSMADLVIDLPLTDDGFIEGPEDFEFGLMNAASTTGLSPTVSATEGSITTTINDPADSDSSAEWSLTGPASSEEGTTPQYTVALSGTFGAGEVISVDLDLSDLDNTSDEYDDLIAAIQTAADANSNVTFDSTNGTLTYTSPSDGSSMADLVIDLPLTDDGFIEGPEDFEFGLMNAASTTGLSPTVSATEGSITTTINDPADSDSSAEWSLTGPASSEEGTTPQYTVALSGTFGAGEVISVDLDLSDLDNTSDEYDDLISAIQTAADANSNVTFDSTNGTLTYTSPSDGSSMADLVIDLPLTDDGFIEGPEDFEFGLMNAASTTGLSPTVSTTEGSITTTINDPADSDSSAEWSLTGPASSEEGTTPQYTVALSGTFGAGEVISVDLDLSDLDNTSDEYDDLIAAIQTAADANSNVTFDSTNGTLTYTSPSDGSSMADLVIDLPLTDDGFIEGPEDFEFGLMNAASTTGLSPTVSATEGSITTTINDPADSDSSAEWSLTGPASSEEGTTPQYTVALSGTFGAGEVISVDLDLSDLDSSSDEYDDLIAAIQTAADANSNVTFDSTNGTLTYTSPSDGASMADLVVDLPLTDDGFIEGPEDFEFGLMNAASTTGLSPTVSATEGSITTTINDPADSDSSAEWSLTGPASSEEGTTPQYTVALSGTFGAGEVISVDLDLSDLDSSSDEYDDLIAAIQTAADANSNVTFDSTNGTLTYTSPSDGSSMADLVVDLPLTDDGFIEGPEDFEFGLMNAASTTGLSPTVSATEGSITTTINDPADSDSSAEWSLTGPASSEEGTTPQYTVALSGTFGAGEVISVDLDLSDLDSSSDEYDDLIAAIQTAADANSNVTFDSTNGTLTYTSPSDGSSMADLVVDLPLTDDGFIEGPEDFEFGLMNAASTTGLSPTVSATEGSITTTINDPADSDSSADPTPLLIGDASVTKSVVNSEQDGTNVNLTVRVVLENSGTASLNNLILRDDLTAQFGQHFKSIVVAPVIVDSNAAVDPGLNESWSDDSTQNIFDGTGTLNPGESITVELVVMVDALGADNFSIANQVSGGGTALTPEGTPLNNPDGSPMGPIVDFSGSMNNSSRTEILFYTFDSINDFSRGFEQSGQFNDYERPLLTTQISSVAPEPIFSGSARPGTRIICRIYDSYGHVVAEEMAFTDLTGNWMVQMQNGRSLDHYRVEFVELVSQGDSFGAQGDIFGYPGTDTFQFDYSNQNPWTQYGEPVSIGTVFLNMPSESLDQMHRENLNPIGFGE